MSFVKGRTFALSYSCFTVRFYFFISDLNQRISLLFVTDYITKTRQRNDYRPKNTQHCPWAFSFWPSSLFGVYFFILCFRKIAIIGQRFRSFPLRFIGVCICVCVWIFFFIKKATHNNIKRNDLSHKNMIVMCTGKKMLWEFPVIAPVNLFVCLICFDFRLRAML